MTPDGTMDHRILIDLFRSPHAFDQIDKLTSDALVRDALKCAQEFDRGLIKNKVSSVVPRMWGIMHRVASLAAETGRNLRKARREARALSRLIVASQIIEKKSDRDVQHTRHLIKSAGPDLVGPPLVFLHLLECQSKRNAKLFLRHSQ